MRVWGLGHAGTCLRVPEPVGLNPCSALAELSDSQIHSRLTASPPFNHRVNYTSEGAMSLTAATSRDPRMCICDHLLVSIAVLTIMTTRGVAGSVCHEEG